MTIDCILVLGPNGAEYAQRLRRNLLSLASGRHTIRWRCILVEGGSAPDGFETVGQPVPFAVNASVTHAHGLNQIADIAEGDAVLFSDADVAVTYPDWDAVMLRRMTGRVAAFGTSHFEHLGCYRNFPCPIFMMMRTRVLKTVRPDFMPGVSSSGEIIDQVVNDPQLAAWWGVPVGHTLHQETSVQFPIAMQRAGYEGVSLPLVLHRDDHSAMGDEKSRVRLAGGKGLRMSEYHLDGKMFCTHLLGSRDEDPDGKKAADWAYRVGLYLNKLGKGVY